jgi:hypothetical protein
VNDDEVESKRVEIVRLAQADNQPAVRFRFANVGSDSYYFGIDDFGLYSLNITNPPLIVTAPANQSAAIGNSATLTASAIGIGPLSYQWQLAGTNLPGSTSATLTIPTVRATDAGNYQVVVSNAGGSVTSSPPAVLTVINPAIFVTGQWDFNGDLRASCGNDLQYFNIDVQTNTSFGTTTSFGIANVNGVPTTVMKLTPPSGNSGRPGANSSTDAWGGYKMFHGAAPNGGGTNLNQYTLIFDVLYPASSDLSWRALLQTSTTIQTGADDSEFYVNDAANGVGINGVYDGNITADTWHRIALAVDLSGPGVHPIVAKFVDGVKVGQQSSGLTGTDDRYSIAPTYALLFSENSGYNNDAFVSSVQFSNGRRPDEFLAAVGGPSASKIPGCIRAAKEGGNVVIRWTGGVPLEGADQLTGPWTTVLGATSPYTVPTLGAQKYYRPKIL